MYINKTLLLYPGFIIALILVGAVFITATTYSQLGIAIVLYPILAFFAYKLFLSGKSIPTIKIKTDLHNIPALVHAMAKEQVKTQTDNIGIGDINKRAFLKLIGATGLSFFLISIFGQRIQSLLFGRGAVSQNPASTANTLNNPAAASPTEGYNISEVDDSTISYFGFINEDGLWFIMKGDANTGSFRYVRGKSNFPANWKNRQNLEYDYFSQVFP
mgnify:CR=1 FL=1